MTHGSLWRARVTIGLIGVGDHRVDLLLRRHDIIIFLREFRAHSMFPDEVGAAYTLFQFNGRVVYRHETMEDMVEYLKWIELV